MKQVVFAVVLGLCAAAAAGCVPPQQQQQPMMPMVPMAQPAPAPMYAQPQPMATQPAPMYAQPPPTGAPPAAAARNVGFNGAALDARGLEVLAQLEAHYRTRLADGDYWYDATSGAGGTWGGPAAVVLPAGLQLGGPLPANASGGGSGRLTGVFVNGRELHPLDVQALLTFTPVYPGRYWVDGQGNGGTEGSPVQFNLYTLANAARSRGGSRSSSDANGSIWTGGGGFNSSWKSDGGDTKNTCSYDPSDGAGVMCSKTSR